jgi:hypothetical protein
MYWTGITEEAHHRSRFRLKPLDRGEDEPQKLRIETGLARYLLPRHHVDTKAFTSDNAAYV